MRRPTIYVVFILTKGRKRLSVLEIAIENRADLRRLFVCEYPRCTVFGEQEVHFLEGFAGGFLHIGVREG